MNHQPFELWLLDDGQLSREQQHSLREHLAACAECRRLQDAWHQTEKQLKASVPARPAEGFAARWKANLPARIQQKHARQLRLWVIGLSLAAIINLAMLTAFTLISGSAIGWFVHLVRSITLLIDFVKHAGVILSGLKAVTPHYVWVIAGVIAAGWIVVTSFAWLLTLLHINKKGVRNENFN